MLIVLSYVRQLRPVVAKDSSFLVPRSFFLSVVYLLISNTYECRHVYNHIIS